MAPFRYLGVGAPRSETSGVWRTIRPAIFCDYGDGEHILAVLSKVIKRYADNWAARLRSTLAVGAEAFIQAKNMEQNRYTGSGRRSVLCAAYVVLRR